MRKRFIFVFEILLVSFFILISCKAEVEYVDRERIIEVEKKDNTAPREITDVSAIGANNSLLLTWRNSSDEDFFGTRISFTPIKENVIQPIIIEGKAGEISKAIFNALENGTEYTFSLTAIDKSQNVSKIFFKKSTPTSSADLTPPSDVTNLKAFNKGSAILLTWEDSTDNDIFGYEVTYSVNEESSIANNKYLLVSQGYEYCLVSGLSNDISYNFIVKSVDTSGNKSSGSLITATPEFSTLSIELSIPEELSNTTIPVTAKITSTAEITKVVYKKNGSENPTKLLNDNDVLIPSNISSNTWLFYADEKTYWTVAAEDSEGRQQTGQIYAKTIDKIPPAEVTSVSSVYNTDDKSVTFQWIDPVENDEEYNSPFNHVCITYKADGSDEIITASNYALKGKQTIVVTNVDNTVDCYIFIVHTVDKLGNVSEGVKSRLYTANCIEVSNENYAEKIASMTQTGVIKFNGEFTNANINSIRQELDKLPEGIFATIDLSDTEGITIIKSPYGQYFNNCLKINGIIFPKSLLKICMNAFTGCSNLRFAEFSDTTVKWYYATSESAASYTYEEPVDISDKGSNAQLLRRVSGTKPIIYSEYYVYEN